MRKPYVSIVVWVVFYSCGSEPGAASGSGPRVLMNFIPIPPGGEQCPNGGERIQVGLDSNEDGTLASEEVSSENKSCVTGGVLINTIDLVPGEVCARGGVLIQYGVDDDADGTLDPGEVESAEPICVPAAPALDGIVFVAGRTSSLFTALYYVQRDGGGFSTLAAPQVAPGGPIDVGFNHDRTRVLVRGSMVRASPELFSIPIDGGPWTRISDDLVGGGGVAQVLVSPDAHHVAYLANQTSDDVFEIYAAFADGRARRRISGEMVSGGSVNIFTPWTWSPDSAKILYIADQDQAGTNELYVGSVDEISSTRVSESLTAGGNVSRAEWSPDASRIAYIADRDQDQAFQIFTVAADGTGHADITPELTGSQAFSFWWSPTGARLAFETKDADGTERLFTCGPMREAVGEVTGVPGEAGEAGEAGEVVNLRWSPDGARLAYEFGSFVTGIDLYTANADGTGRIRVSEDMGPNDMATSFVWSPDGSRLAYDAGYANQANEVHVVAGDGGPLTRLSAGIGVENGTGFPAWSPDGKWIAVTVTHATLPDELWVYAADGSEANQVSNAAAGETGVTYYQWAPDSSALVYASDHDRPPVAELFVVEPQGSNHRKISGDLETGLFGDRLFWVGGD